MSLIVHVSSWYDSVFSQCLVTVLDFAWEKWYQTVKPGGDDWGCIYGGERSAWEERGQTCWWDCQDGPWSCGSRQTGLYPSYAQPEAAAPSRHPHRWGELTVRRSWLGLCCHTKWLFVQGLIEILISIVTQWRYHWVTMLINQVLSCGPIQKFAVGLDYHKNVYEYSWLLEVWFSARSNIPLGLQLKEKEKRQKLKQMISDRWWSEGLHKGPVSHSEKWSRALVKITKIKRYTTLIKSLKIT